MAKIKKTLQEQEDVLIQQKAKLDKKLKAVQNKLYENKSFATTETKYCKYSKKVIIDSILEVIEDAFPQ